MYPTAATRSLSCSRPAPACDDALGACHPRQACLESFAKHSTTSEVEMDRLPRTARVLQVPYVHVELLKVVQPQTVVHDEPPLSEQLQAAQKREAEAEAELKSIDATLKRKAITRQWHWLQGAVSYLKGETDATAPQSAATAVQA